MIKKIKLYKPHLIHAHYGLSGLLASLQRKIPVITTYHGSDINLKQNRKYSYLASILSADNIFVNSDQPSKIHYKNKINIIPCGVDTKVFFSLEKETARNKLEFESDIKYILFTSSFDNKVKNYLLAKESILLSKHDIVLLELKNYSRKEVNILLNAVDALVMTSFTEGSPMIIKEAMCCNCPIVSVDVGDVKSVIKDTNLCFTTTYDASELAKCIDSIIESDTRTDGREKVEKYSLENISTKVLKIYKKIGKN